MPLTNLQSAILQSTILLALSSTFDHEIGRAYIPIQGDPVLMNFTTSFSYALTNSASSPNSTLHIPTMLNDLAEPFYTSHLPRSIFIYVLLLPLHYYWHIMLESVFPARSRPHIINSSSDFKEKPVSSDNVAAAAKEQNSDAVREEVVIQRQIACGKFQRPMTGISWFNTLIKATLDITFGKLLYEALWYVLDGLTRGRGFSKIFAGDWSVRVLVAWTAWWFSFVPFAMLVVFAVVEKEKRVVVEEALVTGERFFWAVGWRVGMPLLVRNEVVRGALRWVTEMIYQVEIEKCKMRRDEL